MGQYGISEDQLIAITIDSGANVTRAVDDLILDLEDGEETAAIPVDFNDPLEDDEFADETDEDFELEEGDDEEELDPELENVATNLTTVRVHCAAHKLQLAINGFLFKDERNSALSSLAHKLAARLRTQVMRLLVKAADLNYAVLSQKTRWNSTYDMLVSLLGLRAFCVEKSATLPGLNLSAARWNAIKGICATLKPMADLTTQLQFEDLDVTQMVGYWKSAMFTLQRLNTTASRKLQ